MTGKALSRRVRELVMKHLGRPMSLHLFRDSAATTVAVHDSAKIGIVGGLLGHARHETNEKHYNQAKGIEAGRRYHGLLKGDLCAVKVFLAHSGALRALSCCGGAGRFGGCAASGRHSAHLSGCGEIREQRLIL